MQNKALLLFIRSFLGVTVLLLLTILGLLYRALALMGRSPLSGQRLVVFGGGGVGILFALGLLIATWLPMRERLTGLMHTVWDLIKRLRLINLLLFGIWAGGFAFLEIGRYGRYLEDLPLRFAVYLSFTLIGGLLVGASGLAATWQEAFIASALLLGGAHRIAAYASDISAYPFSLNWSEASRYYYASLFLAQRIYGISVPPSVLHPSRYLMQALPFLIPDSPIWLHRLWQVALWVGVTFLSAYVLTRRLGISPQLRRWSFLAWVFLFLLMGPVYYHLQIVFILVLILFRPGRFWRSLGVIILSSFWAGLSRINWFPMPAMLGVALYLLEEPLAEKPVWRYLSKPLLWGSAGLLTAFAAQALYVVWSGNPREQFASSLASDLLWYRLLPNPTYPLGVLPAAILVSLPLAGLISIRLVSKRPAIHPLRLWALGAMLMVLFGGGLVVSVKIGGGSNLHNLDAYLTLLMLVAAYFYFERMEGEVAESKYATLPGFTIHPLLHKGISACLLGLALFFPLYFALIQGEALPRYDFAQAGQALERLERLIQNNAKGEVLFISERQLLTFHYLKNIPLVADYEKVFLMEMAMAGNPLYLGRFYDDLRNQRFDLIVSEPLFLRLKGRSEAFGEENDAWVRRVSEPVLCYYKPFRMLREVRLQLLIPREDVKDCSSGYVLDSKHTP